MTSQYIVGLDIGSGTVKAVVAETKKDGHLAIVQVIKLPSDGVRKGMVDDLSAATRSANLVVSELKQINKNAARNIYLGIGTPNVRIQRGRGSVAVSRADFEIYKDDIARAVEGAESVKLPANRKVIHTITDDFVVDDVADIKDPLGMIGHRLEARSMIIDAFAPAVNNIQRCLEVAGGSPSGMIFNPLAAARAVLTRNQRELGSAVVDIGLGTTGIAVYQDNKLLHTAVLPFGSGHISNDLAIGLKTSIEAAEGIKLSFGAALSKEVPLRETVELAKFDVNARGNISRRYIADIIEIRLAEIFEFLNNDLKTIGKAGQLPGGVILVGGGAKLPGVVDLVRQEMRLPARVGIPDVSGFEVASSDITGALEDPEFACALGLVHFGVERAVGGESRAANVSGLFKKLLNYFMP